MCADVVGVDPINSNVVARPWVEVVNNNDQQHGGVDSATFERLGMKNSNVKIPDLEVSNLETRPLTPLITEDDLLNNAETIEMNKDASNLKISNNNESEVVMVRVGSMKKVLSPSSAEVLARRDSVRGKISSQRMTSKRTLQFQSPVEQVVTTDHDHHGAEDTGKVTLGRRVRRSVSERLEQSRRWSVLSARHDGGATSQSEDERGSSVQSNITVIRHNKNR